MGDLAYGKSEKIASDTHVGNEHKYADQAYTQSQNVNEKCVGRLV